MSFIIIDSIVGEFFKIADGTSLGFVDKLTAINELIFESSTENDVLTPTLMNDLFSGLLKAEGLSLDQDSSKGISLALIWLAFVRIGVKIPIDHHK